MEEEFTEESYWWTFGFFMNLWSYFHADIKLWKRGDNYIYSCSIFLVGHWSCETIYSLIIICKNNQRKGRVQTTATITRKENNLFLPLSFKHPAPYTNSIMTWSLSHSVIYKTNHQSLSLPTFFATKSEKQNSNYRKCRSIMSQSLKKRRGNWRNWLQDGRVWSTQLRDSLAWQTGWGRTSSMPRKYTTT